MSLRWTLVHLIEERRPTLHLDRKFLPDVGPMTARKIKPVQQAGVMGGIGGLAGNLPVICLACAPGRIA
jgi:hypothetical protein